MILNKNSIINYSEYTIAVLITSFNRVDKSLNCVTTLYKLNPFCDVYLVDDNSNDKTVEIVSNKFPNIKIINGDGNLYWNRGMHLAWEYACKKDYDFYLWLNDDIVLYDNCFIEIFECSLLNNHFSIISGIIETKNKSKIIYGGTDINNKLITPNNQMQIIKNLNGNVVLIPKKVFKILGNLDPTFHHDLGDVEYGYRATKAGIKVLTTRKTIAYGYSNHLCRVRLNNSNIIKRFTKLYSPLGANPFIIYYFRKKYFGVINAILYFIFLHFLNFIPDIINKFLFKTRYK